jgi:hypothetical protein
MTAEEAQHQLFLHWPGFMPQARYEAGKYRVRLVAWPPSDDIRGELQACSMESYASALLDLATFTPPMIRCRAQECVLCVSR